MEKFCQVDMETSGYFPSLNGNMLFWASKECFYSTDGAMLEGKFQPMETRFDGVLGVPNLENSLKIII